MKLHYFDIYGKAEPIRMLCKRANLNFEDNRHTMDTWKPLKESGWSPTGQLPVLEMDDGQKLTQCNAIMRLLATQNGLVPKDPMTEYHAESALIAFEGDFWGKNQPKLMAAPVEQFPEIYETIAQGPFKDYCKQLEGKLTKGKWIAGDDFTWYDIMLCSFFVNVVENPNNKGKASWDKVYGDVPDRVKQYIADFKAEFADHLASRPPSMMGL